MATRDEIEQAVMRGENARAKQAFLDYLALGPTRSMSQLLTIYRDPDKYSQNGGINRPPTRQMKRLQVWSAAFKWQERVNRVRDDQIETILREQKRQIAETAQKGFASKAVRIAALNEIAEMLMEHVRDSSLITTVIKQVGSGRSTRMVEEKQIDALLVSAMRGVLSDLAAETGGRVRRTIIDPKAPLIDKRTVFLLPPVQGQSPPALPEPVIEVEAIEVLDADGTDED